jgi:hypothetical protein
MSENIVDGFYKSEFCVGVSMVAAAGIITLLFRPGQRMTVNDYLSAWTCVYVGIVYGKEVKQYDR